MISKIQHPAHNYSLNILLFFKKCIYNWSSQTELSQILFFSFIPTMLYIMDSFLWPILKLSVPFIVWGFLLQNFLCVYPIKLVFLVLCIWFQVWSLWIGQQPIRRIFTRRGWFPFCQQLLVSYSYFPKYVTQKIPPLLQ